MSWVKFVTLRCDVIGCVAQHVSTTEYLYHAELQATRRGWRTGVPGVSMQAKHGHLCPEHREET